MIARISNASSSPLSKAVIENARKRSGICLLMQHSPHSVEKEAEYKMQISEYEITPGRKKNSFDRTYQHSSCNRTNKENTGKKRKNKRDRSEFFS